MDPEQTGAIQLERFVSVLSDPDLPEQSTQFSEQLVDQGPGPTPILLGDSMDFAAGEDEDLPSVLAPEMLEGVECCLEDVLKFSQTWTSYGTMSQLQGATWHGTSNPLGDDIGVASRNKLRMSLGHFAAGGFEPPEIKCNTLTLQDTHKNKLQASKRLKPVADALLPHPIRYHLVWSQLQV